MKHLPESLTISLATKTAYAGGALSLIGGISMSEMVSLFGCFLAAIGTAVNVYFRWRRDKREAEESRRRIHREELESQLRMAAMQNGKTLEEEVV